MKKASALADALRAIDGARTRGLDLGKVARYQLRHYRMCSVWKFYLFSSATRHTIPDEFVFVKCFLKKIKKISKIFSGIKNGENFV